MVSRTRRRTALVAGACIVSLLGLTAVMAAPAGAAGNISLVIGGLNAPRGIAFDGQGSMYVAESGRWQPGPAAVTTFGQVSKYAWGQTSPEWTTPFESVYDSAHGPEVLGPEGISAFGNGCMGNSHGQRNGCQIRMIMSESQVGLAADNLSTTQMGHLFRLDGATGVATDLSNVGNQQYQWTSEHKQLAPLDFPDSNPYAVLVTRGHGGGIRTFVADAGANTVSEVLPDGSLRVVAYIPNDPSGHDSTPTCIAQGPDGMLYVGTLDFLANSTFGPNGPIPGTNPGHSNVYRVNPNANFPSVATVWASGLTTVSACTFDRSGNFWATEMFQPNSAGPPGDAVVIPFADPSQLSRVGGGQLPLPGGIAQGPDGAMYLTIGSADPTPNGGAVVRLAG